MQYIEDIESGVVVFLVCGDMKHLQEPFKMDIVRISAIAHGLLQNGFVYFLLLLEVVDADMVEDIFLEYKRLCFLQNRK